METAFGLTEYACGQKIEQVPCILKELYSDFIVQEILADQTVLQIPSPDTIIESTGAKPKPEVHEDVQKPECVSEELLKQFDERFSQKGDPVIVDVEKLEKEERKQIHVFIRERYGGKLITETKPEGISVSHGHTQSSRKRRIWDEKLPKQCHFTMCKENKDTSYALGIIAKFLHVSPNSLHTHGIKDKRGVTAQRVSVRQVEEQKILGLNPILRQISVFDCSYHDEQIQMGGHWGNRFSIILRSIPPEYQKLLGERLGSFQENGYINYFGTQRFGSREANTAEIGLAILRREWEKAVKAILKNSLPQHLDNGTVGHAIRCFQETGNPKWAYSKLKGAQSYATVEGAILKCLMKDGTWQQAVTEAIPVQTRSLYVHAYQSLLWNRAASRRVRENGPKVVEGDVGADGKPVTSHFDIHIPLPGENEAFKDSYGMKWIEEALKEDGLTPESFTSLQDRFSLGESSRALFGEPKDVSWKFINYTDPRAFLQDGLRTRAIPENERVGPLLALQVQFNLVSGAYATVALREITGEDMGKTSMKAASFRLRSEEVGNTEEETDVEQTSENVKVEVEQ